MKTFLPTIAALLAGAMAQAATCPPDTGDSGPVPTIDWRDQVIYFLMIDRFDDGDPENNDQGQGEYDPTDPRRFSGGDLVGACRRLDYIQGLGATAVWITPPVSNQWWDGRVGYGGYHGYWAADFMAVDPHFGDTGDYRRFARALHVRGMALVQDVVVNHTGNFFEYAQEPPANDPARGYVVNDGSSPMAAPRRWPFTLNDPRRQQDRDAGIYHWTPRIADFTDRRQELDFQLAGLDDLATDNPVVRRALREAYGFWIREVGVDAFRVDTAFHVPPDYFRDFLHARDPQHPGILDVARAAGRPDFHVFGEGFGIDRPGSDAIAEKIESYTRDQHGPLLPGMINFPLYGSLMDVFARGRPTRELARRIEATMRVHADPHRMPTFLDNHDVERFLAGGSQDGLRQGLLALMTLPGIPVIYYGTEQGFRAPRAAMFAGGHGSEGRDHFDITSPLYRYVASVVALRRDNPLFSRGTPTILRDSAAGAGVLAYRVDHDGESALVVFNTDEHERLLDNLDTGLAVGRGLRAIFSASEATPLPRLDARGRLTVRLPARTGVVWVADDAAPAAPLPSLELTLDPIPPGPVHGLLPLSGHTNGVDPFLLLLDGDLATATPVRADGDGRWRAQLDTNGLVDPGIPHRVVAWSADTGAISQGREFHVEPAWTEAVRHRDPAGDDAGPDGRYTYPDDTRWRETRPADLREVRALVSGGSLRLELRTAGLMSDWNPPNGFDHVHFTIFLALPGRDDGERVMPLQDAELPAGLRWHRRWRVGGWTSAAFSFEGASALDEGRPVTPAPTVRVDKDRDTVIVTLPATALGKPATLDGARLYVTTWDYDGGYRALQPKAGGHQFGGGQPGEAKVMDDSSVLVLRVRD